MQFITFPPLAFAVAKSPSRCDSSVPVPSVAWALWFNDFSSSLLVAFQKKITVLPVFICVVNYKLRQMWLGIN